MGVWFSLHCHGRCVSEVLALCSTSWHESCSETAEKASSLPPSAWSVRSLQSYKRPHQLQILYHVQHVSLRQISPYCPKCTDSEGAKLLIRLSYLPLHRPKLNFIVVRFGRHITVLMCFIQKHPDCACVSVLRVVASKINQGSFQQSAIWRRTIGLLLSRIYGLG